MADYGLITDLKEDEIAVCCPNYPDFELKCFKNIGGKKTEVSYRYSNPARIIEMLGTYLFSSDALGKKQTLRINQTAYLKLGPSNSRDLTAVVEAHNLSVERHQRSGFSPDN